MSLRDKVILLAVLSVLAWATYVHHHVPWPAPGTPDFSESNYPMEEDRS